MNKESILKALEELRKEEKRKFQQTVDLIINLRNYDSKKQSVNLFIEVPFSVKEKKVCAFLTKKSEIIESIVKADFEKYKGAELKNLAKNYDFFISSASLMPAVAASFGKVLGPLGKMPSPQLGIFTAEDNKSIEATLSKINKIVRIKTKEPSLKIAIGKEQMKDEEIAENVISVYNSILNALPRKKENLKSILIKFTMSKPKKINLK